MDWYKGKTSMKILKFLAVAVLSVMLSIYLIPNIISWVIQYRSNRTYTIHFNANGGEGEMEDIVVEKGDSGWLPTCKFTNDGFECVAWGLDADGTSFATQIDNMTFRLPFTIKNGDTVELYAIWTTPGFSFELETMGYFASARITEYCATANKNIIMPAWYEGSFIGTAYGSCHVANISSGLFLDHTEIETVKNFPDNNLSDDLFSGCSSLKSFEMRQGVSIYTVGNRTFYNCENLQAIELTGNLESIGDDAFYMCTSIEKLIITSYLDDIGSDAFYGWTEEQSIEFTKYSENPFGDAAFNGCKATIIWSGS